MNRTQDFRERFPGIEPKEDYMLAHRIRSFSTYQKEETIVECMKDALSDMDDCTCAGIVVKDGEHWWDSHKFYRRDGIVSELFERSLSWYVTKFHIERKVNDTFWLCVKLHELTRDVKITNLGADLIEYIGNMVEE